MKNKQLNKAQHELVANALKPYMDRAITPILSKLGIFPQKTDWKYNMEFNLQWTFTVPARKIEFTDYQIQEAAKTGTFPKGMTAQDLIGVPSNSNYRKRETCLDLAARSGKLPKGTSLDDLLDTRGGKSRRAVLAIFESQNPKYTPDITAQAFKKIKENKWGTLLHLAARSGVLPKDTTLSDLITGQNREGQTPLHIAAIWGSLIRCSRSDLSRMADVNGKTPWNYAVQGMNNPQCGKEYWKYVIARAVNNITACPALASKLRPQAKFHQAILTELLASPKLTPELRDQLAKYPKICAAML